MEKVTQKPWGCEVLWAKTYHYAAKMLYIKAGHRLSLQYHREKSESIFVDRGRIKLHYIPKGETVPVIVVMTPGDHFDIPAGMTHRFEALDDSCLLEVSTPELEDVVRIEDDYGRDGKE